MEWSVNNYLCRPAGQRTGQRQP